MASITASWSRLAATEQLQRSSHNINAVGSTIYIFGGELKPREPRDNDLHKIAVNGSASVQSVKAPEVAPAPRVGSTSAAIEDKIYFFSGRGGPEMAPVDETGAVWELDTTSNEWTLLKPSSAAHPEARSYHSTASNGKDTIYIHAGCPEKGRLSDLWSFNTLKKEWKQLTSAPDPPRGGTSIAWADGKLYRMNGFDGQKEVGGDLDVYDPAADSWSTISFQADGKDGPGARSVGALLPVKLNGGTSLVTLFGESDPSSLGHQGAGKMLSDIWAYSLEKGTWSEINAKSSEGTPDARGWFDADVVSVDGKDSVAVSGGLGETNERLNDLWVLSF
ncbi:Putative kelch-type beta propeller [Septoria linicola]|uniref:Kelch-type beta propeller n=1 Tax=Septoria linicola TaxID=215465 RepID=A0A9Q9B1V6_9PEZI|nr:Putative kelch-type beta propeller [Septoria linicola]